jgi:hypothetical protein
MIFIDHSKAEIIKGFKAVKVLLYFELLKLDVSIWHSRYFYKNSKKD